MDPAISEALAASLEIAAARCPDPTPLVYARLLDTYPDLAALFVRDRSFIVRGQMLQVAIEGLLDLATDNSYAAGLLQTERVNHQGLGVPPEAFDHFYTILRDTIRDLAATDWTPAMDHAWSILLTHAHHAALGEA
jgi:hemoglobin-like flavoprotein